MAEAKGLSQRTVMFRYAMRNAILPNITQFGMSIGFILAGQLLHFNDDKGKVFEIAIQFAAILAHPLFAAHQVPVGNHAAGAGFAQPHLSLLGRLADIPPANGPR